MFLTEVTEFQTEKGSIYKYFNGRTQRHKSKHDFHLPDDIGDKEVSDKTIFIDPTLAREIGMWQTIDTKQRLILTNKVHLISWNDKIGNWGKDAWIQGDKSFSFLPILGKCPLELWHRDNGMEIEIQRDLPNQKFVQVYKKTHPGNKIIVMK